MFIRNLFVLIETKQSSNFKKIFFDSNFSLTNKETFNAIISFELFANTSSKREAPAKNGPLTQVLNNNPFLVNSTNNQMEIHEAKSCKRALDKVISLKIPKRSKKNTNFL